MTPASFIKHKGGQTKFAAITGFTVTQAKQWSHRDVFPRTAWPELQRAFPKELTLAKLLEMEAAR